MVRNSLDERNHRHSRRKRGRRLSAAAIIGIILTVTERSISSVKAFERVSTSPSFTQKRSSLRTPPHTPSVKRDRGVLSCFVFHKRERKAIVSMKAVTSAQVERDYLTITKPNFPTTSLPPTEITLGRNVNVSNLYFIDILDGNGHQRKEHHNNHHHNQQHQQQQRTSNRLSLVTTRKLWQRRHARTAEEGIRRERTLSSSSTKLSSLLNQAQEQRDAAAAAAAAEKVASSLLIRRSSSNLSSNGGHSGTTYAARTITGLINALADEVDDLEVQVETRPDTPIWGKHVDAVRIQFSRLGFEPLRMGGLLASTTKATPPPTTTTTTATVTATPVDEQAQQQASNQQVNDVELQVNGDVGSLLVAPGQNGSLPALSIDEAFAKMDADNSGTLDMNELAQVLNHVVAGSQDTVQDDKLMEDLASQLVELYDANGDGVVDRYEYQSMVEDMAAVRRAQQERLTKKHNYGFFSFDLWQFLKNSFLGRFLPGYNNNDVIATAASTEEVMKFESNQVNVTAASLETVTKALGSITFSDLKLDLRRLLFGAVPILKHITPGGPLVLEPFTTTLAGSFTREDIMESRLLDEGLRRLIGRALRRRVRNFRDFVDGAVFFGRTWKITSIQAPVVEVSRLTDVEFDAQNRLIVTGRVRIRHSPDAPIIENAFKVRTQLGTRNNGQVIRLVDPELALVLECPRSWERNLFEFCKRVGQPKPKRPEPLYFFFPMYSPFRVEDKDGFDLGEDNCIKSISVQEGALRFEMSAVVRPGRFLGNHYLALTVPKRTFIITLDRVREGIRAARRAKREKAKWVKQQNAGEQQVDDEEEDDDWDWMDAWATNSSGRPSAAAANKVTLKAPKSFFSRFVEGYNEAGGKAEEEPTTSTATATRTEGLSVAISDWFGRQQQLQIKNGKSLKP